MKTQEVYDLAKGFDLKSHEACLIFYAVFKSLDWDEWAKDTMKQDLSVWFDWVVKDGYLNPTKVHVIYTAWKKHNDYEEWNIQ